MSQCVSYQSANKVAQQMGVEQRQAALYALCIHRPISLTGPGTVHLQGREVLATPEQLN